MEVRSKEVETKYRASVDEKGNVVLKEKKKIRRGKKSRSKGGQFEMRVRKDLQEKDWIVDKWSNNFDLENEAVTPAKRKFNPFSKVMTIGTGFPDFIAFQSVGEGKYRIVGVEVKVNGSLNKVEKKKCAALLKKRIFSEIWIASKLKKKNRVYVKYENVKDILARMHS